jgi:hypothetical protein
MVQLFTTSGSTTTSGSGYTPIQIIGWHGINDGVSVALDGSGNSLIAAPGVYALAVHATVAFMFPNVNTTTRIFVEQIAGFEGFNIGFHSGFREAFFGSRINKPGTDIDVEVPGDWGLHAFAVWSEADPPAVVRISVDALEDRDSVVRQVNWKVTWVRLGDAFSF